jgi:hypothetical protein
MSQAKVTKRANFLDNLMMPEPQHQLERHILDPNELKIPRVIVDVQVAESPTRCIGHMVGNRSRNINTLPTGKLRTEIEICVFIIQKKVFIQKADLIEHLPPI